MSRHELAGHKPGTTVVTGWDQPMETYFVHVFAPGDKPRACDGPAVWLGGKAREIYDLGDLERAIRPHAALTPDLASTLYTDRDEGRM